MPAVRIRTGTSTERAKDKKRVATAKGLALSSSNVEVFRSGSPMAVRSALEDIVGSHLINDEAFLNDDIEDSFLEGDSEIDIMDDDEDEFEIGIEPGRVDNAVRLTTDVNGTTGIELIGDDSNLDYFDLVVNEGKCVLDVPNWAGCFRGATPFGMKAVFEIESRFNILDAIGEWLQNDREEFLKSSSWLDLGPKNFEELEDKRVTVLQERLLSFLVDRYGIPNIDKSVFSRYLESCRIVWSDGDMALKEIFSDEAKKGWVAKSVKIFMKKNNLKEIPETQNKLAMPRNRNEQYRVIKRSVGGMDLGDFIIYVSLSAQTSWNNVYDSYSKFLNES